MTARTPRPPFIAALAGFAVALSGLAVVSATAVPAHAVPSTGLMITEVYAGGGNSSATYNADFVELYNSSSAPISLGGKSLQYRSTTNLGIPSGANVFALPAVSVPSHTYFLVKGGGGANGVDIPKTPDAFSSLAMGGTAGQIYLADSAVGIQPGSGSAIDYAPGKVIDFFGYGTGTAAFETATKTGTITTAGSYKRNTLVDNDNNNTDFGISPVAPGPDNCDCVAPGLKITEIYTDGGASGAAYDHDYVEISNPTGGTVPQAGLTLQFRASGDTGPATVIATLTGSMASSTYDLAQLGTSGAVGAPVPSPEYSNPAIDLSASGGTLMIVKGTTPFDPSVGAFPKNQYVADLVGWGASNAFETTAADVTELTSAKSLTRAAGGVDTDMNLDDFSADPPNPNAAPLIPVKTIPEIQGTGPTTPMNAATVTTTGVVTAAYPHATSDDFRGFYMQTPGYDPGADATPDASDGIFVFTGSAAISPTVGQKVTLTGKVSEFSGMTELTVTNPANITIGPATGAEAVLPGTVVPGTDCALPGTDCLTGAALEAAREKHEGEAFQPTDTYTVSDSYDGSPWAQAGNAGFAMSGEIGLAANSDQPLISPTEVANPTSNPAGLAARVAFNNAHMITLDDGAAVDYVSNGPEDTSPFPWLTLTHTVRMGADVTFPTPVVLDFRKDLWRLQPQGKIQPPNQDGENFVNIEQDRPATPDDVLGATGDLKIATFNMLNYFNTLGEVWAGSDGAGGARTCSYFSDKDTPSVRLTNDQCEQDAIDPLTGLEIVLPGPRGAANATSFQRQEDKELEAINTMNADVMSLEEVENSNKLYDAAIDGSEGADKNRDDALIRLVTQLNAHWLANHPGEPNRWAFVPSPRLEAQPTVAEQDAIRSAFIYNPGKVEPVGRSQILTNSAVFRNAREPLAQAFKPTGGGRADAFAVIVNHFKSKGGPVAPATVNGDNVDLLDGAGSYNGDRKRQAAALVSFAEQFLDNKNIEPMFLTGDFNAYSQEDPVKVITGAGYTDLHPDDDAKTYSFAGLAGSLDHVFANPAALGMVTGRDVWEINANESVYYEYSRFNSNVTNLYAVNPFRSSDHNPEIIGINTDPAVPDPNVDTVQILATNDFHGRLVDDPGSAAAGAASMAGAVKELRMQNDSTIFAAAGDLVGASTFESFIQNDEPTIDALNEAGLEVSSVGNHEFDQGFDDLVTRIMVNAGWKYLGANVEFADTEDDHQAGDPALPETWCETLPNGRVVGFVGAVTEDLPALVAGSGIEDIVVTDIVDSVNEHADDLKGPAGCGVDGPADLVIELVHEGAATTAYSSVTDNSTFGLIVAGANPNVDAIVSGHTHLAYNHKVPVQAWINQGRDVIERPVVSAGQYGANLNRLQFEFEPGANGSLVNIRQTVLQLKDYDPDQATQDIVDDAVEFAEDAGSEVLGEIEAPFVRAKRIGDDGQINENRGGESTLGNLIAEMQAWKTEADIGFMNPGGLRADLVGLAGTPRDVTKRQAANTQPFANTLVTMDMTGAQIKTLLEQQWQRDADNNIPSRPFLRLGTSADFTSTFDASRDEGDRITGMWLDGDPIVMGDTYKVSATSFLAGGGDNFKEFVNGTNVRDTGKTDLQAVVDYLETIAPDGGNTPLPVDYGQHQVGISHPVGAPAVYEAGDPLTLNVSSLAMTGDDDVKDTEVQLFLNGSEVGNPAPVSNTLTAAPTDSMGTATVTTTVPAGVGDGTTLFTLVGNHTGTEINVPVPTTDGLIDTTVAGTNQTVVLGQAGAVPVTVTPAAASGTVTLKDGDTVIGTGVLNAGSTSITLPANSLSVGVHQLTLSYPGDTTYGPSQGTVTVTVNAPAAATTVVASGGPVTYGTGWSAAVSVTPATATGRVRILDPSNGNAVLGREDLVNGSINVTIAGDALLPGTHQLRVRYNGDANHLASTSLFTVVVNRSVSTTSVVVQPSTAVVLQDPIKVTATVAASGVTPTGNVVFKANGVEVGTAAVGSDGKAVLNLGPAANVGTVSFTAVYQGDTTTAGSTSDPVTLTVVKADVTIDAKIKPKPVIVDQTKTSVVVKVLAAGQVVSGSVRVTVQGRTSTGPLTNGQRTVQVGTWGSTGLKNIEVEYLGSEFANPASETLTFRVQPAP